MSVFLVLTFLKTKVVLICASKMKEFMKMTSETLLTTRTWYEVENGSNGLCNFVFNSGPQVCSDSSVPKHAVKVRFFSKDLIDKCIFTLWIWSYLLFIDKSIFTVWIWIFTLWIWGYHFWFSNDSNTLSYDQFISQSQMSYFNLKSTT